MAFSQGFLEELKDRNDITEVISKYVALKRAGINLVGLCPFHSEKTPSFTVFPQTRSYYCFGCGAGGDVISFVMAEEGLNYREAVEHLANRAGLQMEKEEGLRPHDSVRRERVIEATAEAARFYHAELYSERGKAALSYLERRGFSQLTIRRFGIGCAPEAWDALAKHLTEKGFTEKELSAAFLCRVSKTGSLYDIFRSRVMFPLIDTNGSVLGFSARRLNENDERKYVNTSDTPAFKKSRFVFAMNLAKNSGSGELILCEGCPDAVALHQAGFGNAAATLGTAITSEQARLIARYAKLVYLSYDSDEAGKNATLKGIRLLEEVGVACRILDLGDVKDPDEYIKKNGAEAFRRVLSSSGGQINYRLGRIAKGFNMSVPEDRLRAFEAMCDYAASRSGKAEREVCSSRISELTGLSRDAVAEEVNRKVRRFAKKERRSDEVREVQSALGYGDKVNHDRVKLPAAVMVEERILGILLVRPELFSGTGLSEDSFMTEFSRRVFSLFKEDFAAGKEPVLSKDGALSAQELSRVTAMMAARLSGEDNGRDTLCSYIKSLERLKLKADYDADVAERGAEALEEYIAKLKGKK